MTSHSLHFVVGPRRTKQNDPWTKELPAGNVFSLTGEAGGEDATSQLCSIDAVAPSVGRRGLASDLGDLGRGSLWSLGAVGATALSGFLFWVIAAATSDNNADVGRAAAWFTVVQLVVALTALGAPILLNRTGGDDDAPAIAGATLRVVAIGAFVLAVGSPIVAGSQWSSLSGVSGPAVGVLVALLATGSALTLGVDARLISQRRWRLLFARSAVPATVRLPLLLISPLHDRATWLLIAAAAPIAASGLLMSGLLLRWRAIDPRGSLTRNHRTFLVSQHLSALATHLPYHAVPLVVARHVSSSLNAAFYLVWGIGVMATLAPHTLSQVLLSETSLDGQGRARRIRLTLFANLGVGILGWAGSHAFGGPVLRQLGPSYEELAEILPWLFVAVLCFGLTSIALTETRLAEDHRLTVGLTWLVAVTALAITMWQSSTSPVWGAVWGWVFAQATGAFVALLLVDRRRSRGARGYAHA